MSQDSPSSVGVVSVSSGSWPWNRIWRLRCRNFSASRLTPGKFGSAASAFASSGSSVQRLDQSERTITTDPFGIRPWRRSKRRTSRTVSAYFGFAADLVDDRDHDERAHRVGRRQLVDAGVLRRPVRRRVELGAELVGGELVRRRLETVVLVGVGLTRRRVDRRLEGRRAEPAPDRHVRGDGVGQVDVGRLAERPVVELPEPGVAAMVAAAVVAVTPRGAGRGRRRCDDRCCGDRRDPASPHVVSIPFQPVTRNDCLRSAFELLPA